MWCHEAQVRGPPAVALAVLLLAGCSKLVDGRAVIAVPRPGSPVQWVPCAAAPSDESRIPPGAECGMLSVPVDYAKPDGDVAQIAMIRFKATGAKIGSLVINPGGPGESGVQAAAVAGRRRCRRPCASGSTWSASIRAGSRRPRPRCGATPTPTTTGCAPTRRSTTRPQGVAHIEKETKDFVQRCVDKMGKEFLANVGTANVVKDLDAMRAALGDEKLTYLGYSYGTRIGASYAEAFPQNVRAMVLDGAVDPNADPIEADIRQAAAFQKAFNDYAADCATDPTCPLGTDPAKAVDVYRSMVDPLVEKPAKTKDPRGLSYSDAIVGTILPLYSPNLWRHLTSGLTELKDGTGDTMLVLADMYMGRDAEGHYNNSIDVRVAVNCVDQPAGHRPRQDRRGGPTRP